MSYPFYSIDDEMLKSKGGKKIVEELIYCIVNYDTENELFSALVEAGFTLPKKITENRCDACHSPAAYVRLTQFSGDHMFCEKHANAEKDFRKEDPSYFLWQTIDQYNKRRNK